MSKGLPAVIPAKDPDVQQVMGNVMLLLNKDTRKQLLGFMAVNTANRLVRMHPVTAAMQESVWSNLEALTK